MLKWLIGLAGAGLLACGLAYAVLDYGFPRVYAEFLTRAGRAVAGLETRHVEIEGRRIAYLDGGEGPTLILLHGFGGEKDNWIRVAPHLKRHYRVIAPDLPCFGESFRPEPGACRIEDQVRYVHAFTQRLGLTQFDLGGNSMGGWIATAYAVAHPEAVRSLWLLAPAGVLSAEDSELIRQVRKGGDNPLLVRNREDLDRILDYIFADRPWLPNSIQVVATEKAAANRDYHQQVFEQLSKEAPLEPQLRQLATPTLIVWGDADRVLHPSGGAILQRHLPASTLEILPEVGHVPMLEVPEQVAEQYRDFRATLPAGQGTANTDQKPGQEARGAS